MKNDPNKLCKGCYEFGKAMNGNNGYSMACNDVWIVCDHEEEPIKPRRTIKAIIDGTQEMLEDHLRKMAIEK